MTNPQARPLRPGTLVAAGVMLAIITLQLVMLARANSCTWDEADYTYAGYMQWKHGDFGLNAEHPPLVKFLATLPLLGMDLKMPPLLDQPYRLQEVRGGREFVFGNNAERILWWAHLATMPLALLLATLVFATAHEMFGSSAGLIALALLSFDPTFLAHSGLVTTDAAQACFMLWSVYAFYRYINVPSRERLLVAGCAAGLALASKHSAVLLFPMLFLLALAELWMRRKELASQTWLAQAEAVGRLALALLGIVAISVVVLWSFYGFHYAARGHGLSLNPTMTAQLARVPSQLQGNVLAWIDNHHLLPQSYTYGFAHVLVQSKAFNSYLLGWTFPHPVWFYFPVAMLIKSTLTFLIFLGVTIWAVRTKRFAQMRELFYLGIPAVVYMLFAMAGGMNIGVRHVLPIYVFLSILSAGVASKLIRLDRRWLYGVVALLLFQAVSVLRAFPAYVSYANELSGGPSHVHSLLSDSSSDWGQQLKSVDGYVNEHYIKDCWFAYFGEGVVSYSYYGIPCKPLITADSLYFDAPHDVPPTIDGPVFMSAGVLSGFEFGPGSLNAYAQFQNLKPVALIDDGVFVFEGHFEIPLASALSHVQKSGVLLTENNAPEALLEAEQAEELAPNSATVNAALGHALDANGRPDAAVPYYQRALHLAQTIEPAFQTSLAAAVQKRLANPKP